MLAHTLLQNGAASRKTERLQSPCNDGGASLRILLKKFLDGALKTIELAGRRTAHWFLNRCLQVLLNAACVHVQMQRDAAQGPALGVEIVDIVDLLDRHHGFSLLSTRNSVGTSRLLFARRGSDTSLTHNCF